MEMEEHLGIKLVERSRTGILLTQKGTEVLRRIRVILGEVEQLERRARQRDGVLDGLIRIGLIPTVAPYLVPRLIPKLRETYPKIEIELKEAVTDRLLIDLHEGRLDAVIAALPVDAENVEKQVLFADRFFMAMANNNSEVLTSPLMESQVDADRLLLLEEGHCLREQALSVCGTAGKRSLVNFGATSMATLLQMVSHNMGMTLIPEMAIASETARNNLRIVPFADPAPSREIGLIWRKSTGRAADIAALAEAAQACAPERTAEPPLPRQQRVSA
jgi:LysR family hydrogen peroxide-inducible transcriptional activator